MANKKSLNGLETGGFGVRKLDGICLLFLCVSFESFEKTLNGTERGGKPDGEQRAERLRSDTGGWG